MRELAHEPAAQEPAQAHELAREPAAREPAQVRDLAREPAAREPAQARELSHARELSQALPAPPPAIASAAWWPPSCLAAGRCWCARAWLPVSGCVLQPRTRF